MKDEPVQLAGVLVHARLADLQAVTRRIGALRGARVHAASPDGKLVVTLEADTGCRMLGSLEALRDIAGVVSASLVYEHTELSGQGSDS